MEQDRDLFLSEYIINYLQSIYPDIYGDTAIINNYIRYKILKDKDKEDLTDSDKQELEELNIYFYGNSDGSSSGSGNALAMNYIKTVNIIKDLISKNDNAVRDTVKNLVQILSIDEPVNDEAFKTYLNKVIIPELISNDEISTNIKYNIKSKNNVIKSAKEENIKQKDSEKKEKLKLIEDNKKTNDKTNQ